MKGVVHLAYVQRLRLTLAWHDPELQKKEKKEQTMNNKSTLKPLIGIALVVALAAAEEEIPVGWEAEIDL